MSEYRIYLTDEFRRKNAKLSAHSGISIDRKLEEYVFPRLRQEPHHGPNIKRLQGYEPLTWRYRVGNYRIFYVIAEDERIVYLLSLDDRKDAYR